jgi:hypothetical protein
MRPAFRVALLLCAAAAAGCDSPRTPLEAHELQQAAKSLGSLCAEAQLLSRELAAHSVTADFAWVHQQALAEESLKLSRQLAKPVPAPLRDAHEGMSALNARFLTDVTRIAQARGAPQQLAGLEQDLRRLAGEAQAMEQRL